MREFRLKARVYFSDTDAGGIAYHRSYFDWAEHGRTEMLREAVPEHSQSELAAEDGILTVIKAIEIHYRIPAHLDDEVEIITAMDKVQRFSCTIRQRIVRGDDVLADLNVKAAFISKATKRPVPIPQDFLAAFEEAK